MCPPAAPRALTPPPAGNLGPDDASTHPQPDDLVTPTLKSPHYTTGRGGSGNMARNDPAHPERARASQDVDAPARREPDGPLHYGRGGAANFATPTPAEEEARGVREKSDEEGGGADGKGLVDRGWGLLSKLGGKK